MEEESAGICGYTQEELESNFKEYIENAAKVNKMADTEMLSEIKYWYNGYSWDGKTFVYNPFSTLAFFRKKEFESYWFATGTPTFLIKQIEKEEELKTYIEPQVVSSDILRGADEDEIETTGLLFQTGYLTVKEKEFINYEPQYRIDFPNMEVKNAFLTRLLARYAKKTQRDIEKLRGEVYRSLMNKEEEKLKESLTKIFQISHMI
jgi:hypothetical protein